MMFIDTVIEKLQRHPKRIVFPEGTEPRVLHAAERFVTLKLGIPVLLGPKAAIERAAAEQKTSLDHVLILDPATADDLPTFTRHLVLSVFTAGTSQEWEPGLPSRVAMGIHVVPLSFE